MATQQSGPAKTEPTTQKTTDDANAAAGIKVDANAAAGIKVNEPVVSAGPAPVAGDVSDPRTGRDFVPEPKGLQGTLDIPDSTVGGVTYVDPKNIPAEVTPGVQPNSGGDKLLAAAQAKAPSLTAEFVKAMGLAEQDLADIANGAVPPPPTPGPAYSADMYSTPAGFIQTAPGTEPGASTAISR